MDLSSFFPPSYLVESTGKLRGQRKNVVTLPKLDISGKTVDKIIPPAIGFVIFIDLNFYPDINPAKLAVISALQKLSVNSNKKNRLRDFIVFTGKMALNDEENHFAICLPQKISTPVTELFFNALRPYYHLDWSESPLMDVAPEPLVRYINGKIIIYTDASSPSRWLPTEFEKIKSWHIDWEARSVQGPDIDDLRVQSQTQQRHYGHIQSACLPEKPLGGTHTFQDHQRLSEALHKILFPTGKSAMVMLNASPPFGYKQLRELCEDHLGITVQEDTLPGGYSGILRVGHVSVDAEGLTHAPVLIRIERSLPVQTKYVALAHEIAHYRFHFIWLLTSNIAFDLALKVPEVIVILRNLLSKNERMSEELEQQADLYSSYFLLPAQFDFIDTLSKKFLLRTRFATPQEIAWDLLTYFFPYENVGRFSWKEYEARSQHAMETWLRLSLGIASKSLVERYFAAIMSRIAYKKDIWSIFGRDSMQDAVELVYLLAPLSRESTDLRPRVKKLLDNNIQTENWRLPASMEEFQSWFTELALAYLGPEAIDSIEVILPSKRTETGCICPVTVLVPSYDEVISDIKGRLVPLPSMSAKIAATREEWIKRLPDHLLLIAYIPKKSLKVLENDARNVATLILLPTLDNLDMRFDRDWYGTVTYYPGKAIEISKPHMSGTLEEWAVFCTKHCLRPEFQKLSKTQIKELLRIKLIEPYFAFRILEDAKSIQEVDQMIANAKKVLPFDVLPWEKKDYFGSSKNAYDYAMRILRECVNGRLLQDDFWDFLFKVEKIFKAHKIPTEKRLVALEILREELVDNELGDFFDPCSKCSECGRSFVPLLTQEYVQSTLIKKRVLCSNCNSLCKEQE